MTNKYRSQPSISTQSEEKYADDHWMRQFENKLNKVSVQPANNLFDQISSIMNGSQSKYKSVDEAVISMMERSGLTTYLDAKKAEHQENIKNAATAIEYADDNSQDKSSAEDAQQDKLPKLIKEKPEILTTLENIINDSKGNLPVPAIIHRLHSIHSNDVSDDADWEDEKLIHLVSLYNLNAKKDNPGNYTQFSNLGQQDRGYSSDDIDKSNTDAFNILMPAKQ